MFGDLPSHSINASSLAAQRPLNGASTSPQRLSTDPATTPHRPEDPTHSEPPPTAPRQPRTNPPTGHQQGSNTPQRPSTDPRSRPRIVTGEAGPRACCPSPGTPAAPSGTERSAPRQRPHTDASTPPQRGSNTPTTTQHQPSTNPAPSEPTVRNLREGMPNGSGRRLRQEFVVHQEQRLAWRRRPVVPAQYRKTLLCFVPEALGEGVQRTSACTGAIPQNFVLLGSWPLWLPTRRTGAIPQMADLLGYRWKVGPIQPPRAPAKHSYSRNVWLEGCLACRRGPFPG